MTAHVEKGRQMDDTINAYSIAEVMARVGLGRDAIYRAIKDGDLIARKRGKRTLILADDLKEFLHSLPRLGGEAA
jgi:excisionase family DNA binding protein